MIFQKLEKKVSGQVIQFVHGESCLRAAEDGGVLRHGLDDQELDRHRGRLGPMFILTPIVSNFFLTFGKSFSEKFDKFRCEISGNLII